MCCRNDTNSNRVSVAALWNTAKPHCTPTPSIITITNFPRMKPRNNFHMRQDMLHVRLGALTILPSDWRPNRWNWRTTQGSGTRGTPACGRSKSVPLALGQWTVTAKTAVTKFIIMTFNSRPHSLHLFFQPSILSPPPPPPPPPSRTSQIRPFNP